MRRIVELNGNAWRLGAVPQKPFGDVDDLNQVQEWLQALVPGDVRLDLLRAGRIPDPYFACDNVKSQWVDAWDWWYTRSLELELDQGQRAFLVFEGIDYQSAVFLNHKLLGRHTGMFSRQVYEITETIGPGALNGSAPRPRAELAVRVWGSDALPKMQLGFRERLWKRVIGPSYTAYSQAFDDRYATLKCQMQFGWDFAPRLRTCGIWDDVVVVLTGSVFIEDIFVQSEPRPEPSRPADITVDLLLNSDQDRSVLAIVRCRGRNFDGEAQSFSFDLTLAPGRHKYRLAFKVEDVHLWNPWDRGDPNLYDLEIEIRSRDSGQELDRATICFGIRSVQLVPVASAARNAEPWTFIINGMREFIRGANWVPLDAIPGRLSRENYRARLEQVLEANVNFLRVWGGGLKEKRAFYELCDELGILVWQEFPFAGAILDRFPQDPAFLSFVREETGAIVRSLRNHPALVLWCGGNEFNTRSNRATVETLRQVVAEEDGTRSFKPASPYRDESHNWRVWHRSANLRDYRRDRSPFMSEFGLQSAPDVESLTRFLPRTELYPPNELWTCHRAELKKLVRYARPASLPTDSNVRPRKLEDFVAASQRAQAFGLQIAIEHMRRRKGRTAGVAVWQFDDPWPAISWSLVDYYGRPKRAFEQLKQVYSPLLASFDYALKPRRAGEAVRGDLWLINDRLWAYQDVDLRAFLNDREIYAQSVGLAADSSERVGSLDIPLGQGDNWLRLVMREGGRVLSENIYDLNFCDVGEINPLIALIYSVYMTLMR